MNCQDTREEFATALLSRTALPPEVAAHLSNCPDCRADLLELEPLPALLGHFAELPAHANGVDELSLQRLLQAARAESRPARMRRLIAAVAASVLFVGMSAGWLAAATRHERPVHTYSAVADTSGVAATITVSAAAAGSSLRIRLTGVTPGTKCTLLIRGVDGQTSWGPTWVANYSGAASFSASVPLVPASLSALDVVDSGTSAVLVSVPLSA